MLPSNDDSTRDDFHNESRPIILPRLTSVAGFLSPCLPTKAQLEAAARKQRAAERPRRKSAA